jgi:hypothetical protein
VLVFLKVEALDMRAAVGSHWVYYLLPAVYIHQIHYLVLYFVNFLQHELEVEDGLLDGQLRQNVFTHLIANSLLVNF